MACSTVALYFRMCISIEFSALMQFSSSFSCPLCRGEWCQKRMSFWINLISYQITFLWKWQVVANLRQQWILLCIIQMPKESTFNKYNVFDNINNNLGVYCMIFSMPRVILLPWLGNWIKYRPLHQQQWVIYTIYHALPTSFPLMAIERMRSCFPQNVAECDIFHF